MATFYKGVNIQEGEAPSPISGVSQTVTGLMGTFERGEVNKAVVVSNMAQFERTFGSKPLTGITSYFDVKSFFASVGEAPLALVNVKGPSAAKASVTIQDIDAMPKNTLKIEANSEGAWGNNLTVEVLDDNILTTGVLADVNAAAEQATLTSTSGLEIGSFVEFDNGTQQEIVELTSVNQQSGVVQWSGGLTNSYTVANCTVKSQEFKIVVYEHTVEVEEWTGLSMHDDVSFFCEKLINGNSNYITVTDEDSASTPNSDTMPAATSSPQSLTSGDDDLANLELSHWQGSAAASSGVYAFTGVNNLFRIACPNPKINTDPAVGYATLLQDLLNFANNEEDIEVYGEVSYNKTPTEAATFASNFEGRALAIFYPWIKVRVDGSTVWLPATAGVLGAAAKKDNDRGIYKSVGNERLAYGSDVERYITKSEDETLNNAGVNTIVPDQGLKVWGGRTQSAVTTWRFINHSEQFNFISQTLKGEVGNVAFEPNNSETRAKLTRRVTAFLSNLVTEGGVVVFAVICDETNNPSDKVALGELHCQIVYQPAGVAEKIIFTITSDPSGSVTSALAS